MFEIIISTEWYDILCGSAEQRKEHDKILK